MSRHRVALFGGTLAFYLVIVYLVLVSSWLVALDWKVMLFRPYQQWPSLHAFLDYYVVLGQRGPTAVMIASWLGWRSWRQHTLRPLLTLGAALLLLNMSVGGVKIFLGRLGPHYATQIGSAELFAGGDIFPSGHTANAVVTWGILAYLATTPRARRYLSAISATVSLGVGLTTVYIGTHWLSDVLLGWAAGLLVLLALPWVEPLITLAEQLILAARERWRQERRRRASASVPVAAGGHRPAVPVGANAPGETVAVTVGAEGAPGLMPAGAAARTRPAPHPVRTERAPGAPAGSRRPSHPDRPPRSAAAPARPLGG